MRHLLDEAPPPGVYDAAEAAVIAYARKSTRLEPIDDATYAALAAQFSPAQIVDLSITVGLSNLVNRFHATFQTDVDTVTLAELEAGDAVAGACPIAMPRRAAEA